LPSSNDSVTSPIAHRRTGQGIKSTKREIKPKSSFDTPFRTKIDVFIRTPLILLYENTINGNFVFAKSLNQQIAASPDTKKRLKKKWLQ
jgi:hypothetical protein